MKKYKRWIAILLASLLSLSLCGCQRLDDMRAEHGVWQEDGSVLWNGNVYRKLENTLSLEKFDFVYGRITIYVTEADVPVLLSNVFGTMMDVCADGTLLEYYDYRLLEGKRQLYCREDVYDEMVKTLADGVQLDTYYYYYYDYNREESLQYYLTEEQTNTIHRILTTVTPVPIKEFDGAIADEVHLYICDDSHRFEQDTDTWLCITESCYCIKTYDEIYAIPMKYNGIFTEIWKAYNEGIYILEDPPSLVV